MFSLNVSCPVCKKKFKSDDWIYSLDCGHNFHHHCLQNNCGGSCPVCRHYSVGFKRIYLNYENGSDYETVVSDLNAKLESYKNKLSQKEKLLLKQEAKLNDVKRLYNISEQWRAECQDKICAMNAEAEENGRRMHSEMYEKLKLENSLEKEMSNMILKQEIKTLEIRLEYVTAELQRQFKQNRQLTVSQNQSESKTEKKEINYTADPNASKLICKEIFSKKEKETKLFELKQVDDCSAIIIVFPKNLMQCDLKDSVIFLAAKMNIVLRAEQISNATLMPKRKSFQSVAIKVEFTTVETKMLLLKYRHLLKSYSKTSSIEIKEYVAKDIYPVFAYANRELRRVGYEFVGYQNKQVIARKKMSDTEDIVIKDQKHVAILARECGLFSWTPKANHLH